MNKIIILVLALALALAVGAVYWFSLPPEDLPDSTGQPSLPPDTTEETQNGVSGQKDCAQWYEEIDNDLQAANYCQADADCEVIPLGAQYIEFGCYHFVNKEVDKQALLDRVDQYSQKCAKMIDLCMPTPAAKCVDGKCAAIEDPAADLAPQ